MRLTDWAMTGLGAVLAVGATARRGLDHLSRRGRAVTPGDGTVAGIVDRVVTRDVPAAIGHALGFAADTLVRGVEFTRHATTTIPRSVESAVGGLARGVGIPSAGEIRALRQRLDAVSARLDALATDEEPPAPAGPRTARVAKAPSRKPAGSPAKAARKR